MMFYDALSLGVLFFGYPLFCMIKKSQEFIIDTPNRWYWCIYRPEFPCFLWFDEASTLTRKIKLGKYSHQILDSNNT